MLVYQWVNVLFQPEAVPKLLAPSIISPAPSRRQAKGDMYSPCLSVRLTKIREPGGANGGANRCHSQLSQHCNLFENVGTVLVTRRCELIFRFCSEWESNLILLCWPSRGSEIHSCNSLKQTLLCPATTSKAVESCFFPSVAITYGHDISTMHITQEPIGRSHETCQDHGLVSSKKCGSTS